MGNASLSSPGPWTEPACAQTPQHCLRWERLSGGKPLLKRPPWCVVSLVRGPNAGPALDGPPGAVTSAPHSTFAPISQRRTPLQASAPRPPPGLGLQTHPFRQKPVKYPGWPWSPRPTQLPCQSLQAWLFHSLSLTSRVPLPESLAVPVNQRN